MAKTLAKMEKDYNKIFDKIGGISNVVAGAIKSANDLMQQNELAGREAGRTAGDLRAKGHTGTSLADFKSDKTVAAMIKMAADGQKTIKKQLSKIDGKLAAEHKKLSKDFYAMQRELTEEIAARVKKANRKIFKIKSNSLPDLKKLLKRMDKDEFQLIDDLNDDIEGVGDMLSKDYFGMFEAEFDESLGKTKQQRDAEDIFERNMQIMQHGALRTYKKNVVALTNAVKKNCAEGLKAAKAGKSPKAALDEAAKRYKDLHKIMNILQGGRTLGQKKLKEATRNKNTSRIKNLKISLKMVDDIEAVAKEAKDVLQKVTKATFALQAAEKG
ncbi:MAG: hypothetical protein AB3N23_17725 [Paracoccaceae bacterium]